MLLPGLIVLIAFTIFPMMSAGYLSLFRINLATRQQPIFNGFGNFAALFASPVFLQVLRNTLLYAAGTIPISAGLALFLAVRLNRAYRGTWLFRTLFFYPTVIPVMSTATIWLFMYTPQYGLINRALAALGVPDVNFLGSASLALPAIMAMSVWKDAGYFMVFYLAGLQNLAHDVEEAAVLDGATAWQRFWRITFPLLMPTTLFVGTVALINAFKTVDQLYLMTGGGPDNATNLILFHLFEQAFNFFDRGMASALTVVLVLLLLGIAAIQYLYVDPRVHYE